MTYEQPLQMILPKVPVEMHCPQSTIPTSLLGFGVINLMEGCTLRCDDLPMTMTDTTTSKITKSNRSLYDSIIQCLYNVG